MRVMTMSEITDKWNRRAGAATQDYAQGVKTPRNAWQESTLSAVAAYEQGIADSIANNLFVKGVQKSSNAEHLNRCLTLGVQRYGPGVRESQARYTRGFTPYHAALTSLELPPRGPRGSSQNYDRVRKIGEALHSLRIQGV